MDLNQQIEDLLNDSACSLPHDIKNDKLLPLFKAQIQTACERHKGYANYVKHWPVDVSAVSHISDLPFLPVSLFKRSPPLCLVADDEIQRTLTSSATTGQQSSRIALDRLTAKRMTKGVINILRKYIGHHRRPYLVIDEPAANMNTEELGARGAAIRGLSPFANKTFYALVSAGNDNIRLDIEGVKKFLDESEGEEVLMYGFTTALWAHLVKPLKQMGVCLRTTRIHILHSGGWKKLTAEAVDKGQFNRELASVVGCETDRIIDFYGMVENLGVIYPDCPEGYKHTPSFGEVIVRDPLTMQPVNEGETGVVQVCSVLPNSFPGHLLLTEDMAQVVSYDGCSTCSRTGITFTFAGRIPKSETRGCGNVQGKLSAGVS